MQTETGSVSATSSHDVSPDCRLLLEVRGAPMAGLSDEEETERAVREAIFSNGFSGFLSEKVAGDLGCAAVCRVVLQGCS